MNKEFNMQVDYETFIVGLKSAVHAALGLEEDRIQFRKKGGKYAEDGDKLFIEAARHEDAWEICAMYTEELFERYRKGAAMEELVSEIEEDMQKIRKADIYEKTQKLTDYEKAKNDLFIRLVNAEKHARELEDVVYRTLGDIALVLYMRVAENDGCITSFKIKQSIVRKWDREDDEVFREALLNTYFMSPPRIYSWEKMIFNRNYQGDNFMDLTSNHEITKDAVGNCLSTVKKANGAVAVFLPGVAQRLGQLLEADFYMVFTSIHEVMIHNDRTVEVEDLQRVLKETVEAATPKEDFLTLKIYHYCRETKKFECVDVPDEQC